MSRPEIFRKLRDDHRRVLRELAAVDAELAPAPARRSRAAAPAPLPAVRLRRLFVTLRRQFATHMSAEDQQLFPALALALPESRPGLEPLFSEHDELRALLASLDQLLERPPGALRDEKFRVGWSDFAELLRIHIRKEERLVFGIAERLLSPSEMHRIEALRFPRRPAARGRVPARERKVRK